MVFYLQASAIQGGQRFLSTISSHALNTLRTVHLRCCGRSPLYLRGDVCLVEDHRWDPTADENSWELIWQKLATAANLRNLRVSICPEQFELPEEKLLAPLRALRVENFTVSLPWPLTYPNVLTSDDNEVFQIKRPAPGKQYTHRPLNRHRIPRVRRPRISYRR